MAVVENNSGESRDPIVQSRKIVDLVLQVPHHARDTGRVVDAVGCVLADLTILEKHQTLMKHLGSGITTSDVDLARENILQAAALRPVDDLADTQRQIVLAGLHRIRQATEFNERVASLPNNGSDGFTIFQAGLSPKLVDQAMLHVNEAKALVEAAPRPLKEPETIVEVIESPIDRPIEPEALHPTEPVIDVQDIPVFTSPDDFISIQAGENVSTIPPKYHDTVTEFESKLKEVEKRELSRRKLFKLVKRGSMVAGSLVVASELTRILPVITTMAEIYEYSKPVEQRKLEHEEYMQRYSLSEIAKKPSDGGWEISYTVLGDDEEYIDVFNNNFRQIIVYAGLDTPIYAPIAENNPFLATRADVYFQMYKSRYYGTFPIAKVGYNGSSGWFILTGRKTPESLEQRRYPNVVMLKNVGTNSTYFLEVKPLKRGNKDEIEIRYMKKAKKLN